tara:strand:+ start:37 stop:261 length:225 start_codon:yes stop_codon:yes gene_type:complete
MKEKIKLSELKIFIKEFSDIESENITINSNLKDFDFWDSIFKVQLLVFIENKLQINIDSKKLEKINQVNEFFKE